MTRPENAAARHATGRKGEQQTATSNHPKASGPTGGQSSNGQRRRDDYATVGRAARQATKRARTAKLNGRQWRVLSVVFDLTASYSRLTEPVFTEWIAAEAGIAPKHTREILGCLSRLGVIVYTPGRGTGHRSTVGLHSAEKAPESGGLSLNTRDEKAPGSGVEKAPESEAPTEKTSEKEGTYVPSARRRAPDKVWDTLAEVFGHEPAPRTNAHGRRNKAAADLKREGATPGSIRQAVSLYVQRYGRDKLTDVALATHFAALLAEHEQSDLPGRPALEVAEQWARATGWRIAPENRLDVLPCRDRLTEADTTNLLQIMEQLAVQAAA